MFVVILSVMLSGCAAVKTTDNHNATPFNFVVMGDNRPADIFRPEQPYMYWKVVKKAVDLNPALILNTGDIVLGYDAKTFDMAEKEYDAFDKPTSLIIENNIPLYITKGNHSGYTGPASKTFDKRYSNKPAGNLYYSVDLHNCHFVVLCSEIKGEEAQVTNKQLMWLEEDLQKAAGKHIFVVLHRPLYPKIKHLDDSMNKYPEKRDKLAAVLKKYKVDMVFAGHVHIYNFSVENGLSQIIAGGSGAPLAGKLEDGAFNHFFNVIVNGDSVDYRLIPLPNEVAQATELMQEGWTRGAISLAQKAEELVPDHPMPHIIATVGYKRTGQKSESDAEIAKLIFILGSKTEVYFRLGEFCLAVNQLDLAEQYLAEALSMDSSSFKVVYHYAKLKKATKQNSVALAMYKMALTLTDDDHFIKDIKKQIGELNGNASQ